MTKLLEEAIYQLRRLPVPMQDSVARAVMLQLEQEPEQRDFEVIEEGRREFANGDSITFGASRGPVRTS